MRTARLPLVLIAALALPARGQVIATSKSWPNVQAYFDGRLEPPPGSDTDPAVLRQLQQDVHGGVTVDGGVHRFWRDAEQKAYVGYDLSIERGPDARYVRLHILPLSLTPQQMVEQGIPTTWAKLELPKYPAISNVLVENPSGATIAVDLLVNSKTGQKLVDNITVQRIGRPFPQVSNTAPAVRHPLAEPAADPTFVLSRPRVILNGTLVNATTHEFGRIASPWPMWFYLRGQGRFVLALAPHPEFHLQKAGEASGNSLTFQEGSDTFRIECDEPIAPGGGHYDVYVFHDRTWNPTGSEVTGGSFLFGTAHLDVLMGN